MNRVDRREDDGVRPEGVQGESPAVRCRGGKQEGGPWQEPLERHPQPQGHFHLAEGCRVDPDSRGAREEALQLRLGEPQPLTQRFPERPVISVYAQKGAKQEKKRPEPKRLYAR